MACEAGSAPIMAATDGTTTSKPSRSARSLTERYWH